MPLGEKISSTRATKSVPESAGWDSMMLIMLLRRAAGTALSSDPAHDHLLRGLVLHNHVGGQDAAPIRVRIHHRAATDDAAGVQNRVATDVRVVAEQRAELAQTGVERRPV